MFYLPQRGLVVHPGVPYDGSVHHVLIGDKIEVRREDGQILRTTVAGIEMGLREKKDGAGLVLPLDIRESDVPIGSELWHFQPQPEAR